MVYFTIYQIDEVIKMLTKEQFANRFKNACQCVIAAEQELTDIDAKFGDADHGFTMAKVCNAIISAIDDSDGGIQTLLDDAAMAVMAITATVCSPPSDSVETDKSNAFCRITAAVSAVTGASARKSCGRFAVSPERMAAAR